MAISIHKVYTKGGDKGETSLTRGPRVPKNHPRVDAYGTLDELLVALGKMRTYLLNLSPVTASSDSLAQSFYNQLNQQLLYIQQRVFDVGAILANPETPAEPSSPTESDVQDLEQFMDEWGQHLPELRSFVLPGGSMGNVYAHECRVIARRAERIMVTIPAKTGTSVPAICYQYINRISDYFFVVARVMSLFEKIPEVLWEAGLSRSKAQSQ